MDCYEVRTLLDQYIERDLGTDDMNRIKQHLSSCSGCRAELAYLIKYKKVINSLQAVKAPDNFFEELNQRIYKKSLLSRIVNALFYPFKIKIPIEAAGVLATVVLILLIFNPADKIKENVYEITAPEIAGKEDMKEERIAGRSAQKDGRTSTISPEREERPGVTSTELETNPEGMPDKPIETYEIALIIDHSADTPVTYAGKAAKTSSRDELPSVMGAASPEDSIKVNNDKAAMSHKKQKTGENQEEQEKSDESVIEADKTAIETAKRDGPLQVEQSIEEIEKIILNLNGRLLKKELNKKDQNMQPVRFLIAEIPAENKTKFVNRLKRLGLVKEERIKQPETKSSSIILNINIIHNE